MTKLSEHFTLEEMTFSETAIRHGINNTPGTAAIQNLKELCEEMLEPMRTLAGGPIGVTSGFRSAVVNSLVGGSPTSQHKTGEAADIHCLQLTQQELFQLVRNSELPFDQLIDEFGRWVHVSYKKPGSNRRQVLRARKVNGVTKYTEL